MFKNIRFISNNRIFNKSLTSLKKNFKTVLDNGSDITPKDILSFIIYLMQYVEKYKMNGKDKKEIVIKILSDIVENNKNNIQDVEQVNNFIKNTLPSLIDTIISLDRKEFFIKNGNTVTGTLGCM